MERAARESNALQRQVYEESVQRGQPFYEGGLSGFQTLLDYLGLEGGNEARSREQIRNELLPSYTTQQTIAGGSEPLYVTSTGDITTKQFYAPYRKNQLFQPAATTREQVDYSGLNQAVQEQLDAQAQGRSDTFGSLLVPFGAEQFEADPGYQFRQEEGNKALERRLAAQGKTFSPEAAKELQRFNQGLAAQEYGQAYNRYNIDQSNIYNRLAGIAGMGQQQVQQLDQAGQLMASNIGQTNASLANAQAAAAQSGGSMFNNLMDLGNLGIAAYTAFSDKNLKTDIEHIGKENGHNVYKFKYIGGETEFIGVMAQEVQEIDPDAVVNIGGYLAVDYDRIGVKMRGA